MEVSSKRIPKKCPAGKNNACELRHTFSTIDIPYYVLAEECINLGFDVADIIDAAQEDDLKFTSILCDMLQRDKPSDEWFDKQKKYLNILDEGEEPHPGFELAKSYVSSTEFSRMVKSALKKKDYNGEYDELQNLILNAPATTEDFYIYKGFVDIPFKEGCNNASGPGSSSLLMVVAYSYAKGRNILKLRVPKGRHVLAFTGGCPLEAEIMYPHNSNIYIEKIETVDYWHINAHIKECTIKKVKIYHGVLL